VRRWPGRQEVYFLFVIRYTLSSRDRGRVDTADQVIAAVAAIRRRFLEEED
jgi:hypothetical protein